MAEPLSITANILAVAMTGFKLAQGLYQLADGIGSAGKEVRVYADEIDALSKLLQLIRIHIESAPAEFSYERTLLRDILDACGRILGQIGRIQISLTPLMDRFRSSESKMKALSVRIQWIFCCKDKLLFYLAALRGQHRLLDTTLALMVLQKPKDRSSENLNMLHMSAENSIAAMNNTLIESKHFSVEAFQQTSESSPRMLLESCATEDADRDTDITLYSNMGSRSEARVISEHMVDDEYMQLPAHLENFEESAQDIWEDMRSMLRKLLRHASDTLRDSKENPRQHSPLHHYDPTPGQGAPILSLNMSSAERKELNALRLERVKFNKQRENEKVPAKTKRELEEERAMREILVLEAARIKKERGEIEAKEAKKRAKERAYRESEERRLKSLGAFTYKPEQWR